MSIVSIIFVYFIVWWTALFAVLPLGVERQKTHVRGSDPGAPEKPEMLKKALITSVVSAVLTLFIYWFMTNYGFEYFRDALPNP